MRLLMILRKQRSISFRGRLVVTALWVLLCASVVNAYTIIMRDGRRIEIPDNFTITNTTLTYEFSAGIQVTVQLATIDIDATERTNGEVAGALLRRSEPYRSVSSATATRSQAGNGRRSITNKDLEAYKRTRLQSELAYEKRRKELGLPSLETSRRELAGIEERTRQQLLSMQSQEQSRETYWRNRAASLRTEIAANRAQIDFVRRRLDEIPSTNSFGAFTTTYPFGTFGSSSIGAPFPLGQFPRTGVVTHPGNIWRPGTRVGVSSGRAGMSPFYNLGRSRWRNQLPRFPNASVWAWPFESFDYTGERYVLVNQLNELLMHAEGLQARWREFEEEARKAGAYPGWLR